MYGSDLLSAPEHEKVLLYYTEALVALILLLATPQYIDSLENTDRLITLASEDLDYGSTGHFCIITSSKIAENRVLSRVQYMTGLTPISDRQPLWQVRSTLNTD